MPRKKVMIHERVMVELSPLRTPVGEALQADDPIPDNPMTEEERQDMVDRLEDSIYDLMDGIENTYQLNCNDPKTGILDPDYVARLSTHEFFFHTKEPLTLKEFEDLQNKIAKEAKKLSSGIQLVLGSFAVQTDDGKVMNVTPHISCGQDPSFQFIIKNYTSSVDVIYKIPDGEGDTNTLQVFQKSTASTPMPQIMVNGIANEFTFNNIVQCKTPGGTPFLTAVDVCLDHKYGVAKTNYDNLTRENPELLEQPVSQVVISNSISIHKAQCIGANLTHVDPYHSIKEGCKKDISQELQLTKLPFGNNKYCVIKVAPTYLAFDFIKNNYNYKTEDLLDGRDHKSYTVSLENAQFKKSDPSKAEFQNFKEKYQEYRGDHLKTKILEDLKNRIQASSTKEELENLKEELKTSYERDVLNTGQGWFTQKLGMKTSSIQALEDMIEQQEKHMENTAPKSSA